jgi:hypothetical protein
LLSAHFGVSRVRLQYSPQDIVAFGERSAIERAIGSAEALHRFFSQVGAHINFAEDAHWQGALPPRLGSIGRHLGDAWRQTYFSTRINSPVEALTATVNLAPSRLAP